MTDSELEFDVVVVGAGPAGENAADRAARGGLRVAVVEDQLVGGECSYWACIPSKALLRPVNLALATRRMQGLRPAELDPGQVLARRDYWDSGLDDSGQASWLDSAGLTLVRGHGRLDGPGRVRVRLREDSPTAGDGQPGPGGQSGGKERQGATGEGDVEATRVDAVREVTLLARVAVVLATGTAASLPPIPGLREASPWTNREGTTSSRIPERLVVLGGGVVACELAQAWQALGSQVTVLERSERVLGRMEPFASELVADGLRGQGVDVRTGVTVNEVRRRDDGSVLVTVQAGDDSGDSFTVEADEVLAALGRTPATAGLGLESVGIPQDQLARGGYLPVDETCAVGAAGLDDEGQPWLYAVGDINGRNLLTHMGKYQGRAVGDRLALRGSGRHGTGAAVRMQRGRHATEDSPLVPWAGEIGAPQVVFTDPEVASVGLTESAARDRGLTVRVVDVPMTSASGAGLQADDYKGQARMVVDEDRKVVVGMTFVGQDVAELVHSATIAVVGGVPLARLWHAVPPFPTMSEVWLRLLEAYGL